MANKTPEQKARDIIDKKLKQAGWVVQDKKNIDFGVSKGIAIREYRTDVGPADYVLFVNKIPLGIIEAKKDEEGYRLTVVEGQSEGYGDSKLQYLDNKPLPFLYESTGVLTKFTNRFDPKPRSEPVFNFHRPETLLEKYIDEKDSLRKRFYNLPELNPDGLRDCQFNAINNLEVSFKENRPRALIQMATGSGKTYTAITFIYRLIKHCRGKRILFLVDTKNLGEQAEQELMSFTPNDDNRKFTELYNVQRLSSKHIANDNQVCISTIQRLYSILKGEELDENKEEENPNEKEVKIKEPLPVIYNEKYPPEFFDFIVIDECHRSIYNLWKQVLDYFDSFLIGLTATPDKRTFGFFNENVVSEYTHEEAVSDGVNVGYDIYTIETKITKQGSNIEAKEYIEKREKLTRKKRWEQIDDDYTYSGKELDGEVVNLSQIRNVIKTFKQKLPEIFPKRDEVPKTLVFAKSDSHADDIIKIIREEFGEGNSFCKKITYKSEEDPKSVLSQFRNDYNPRIAVTVDMIATGTDVRPLECLLFMRDVRSKGYFEQMKGRGTRTLGYDDLKKVSNSATSAKTHFVIIDAVGVTKSIKTDSRPLEKKRTTPMKNLLSAVMMGSKDEEVFSSLAGRLARLEKQISDGEKEKIGELSKGKSLNKIVKELLASHDPDKIEEKAREKFNIAKDKDPDEKQLETAQDLLIKEASSSFSGELNLYIDQVRKTHEQIIDTVNIDEVQGAGWDKDSKENAQKIIQEFKDYLEEHKDEIRALQIFYNQPNHRREITFQMIEEVAENLRLNKPSLAPLRIWQAYGQLERVKGKGPKGELTALVSLLRRICGIDEVLTSYDSIVDKNFQDWVFKKQAGPIKFNQEQMEWLRLLKEHIATSFHVEKDDLDLAPFDAQGGVGRMFQLFGKDMDTILNEINEALVA